jgi:pimeloyl-ACP methyl ester carboxylesterase
VSDTRPDVDPASFAVHRTTVRDGVELAYVREGVGGVPLVLLHGWPETKRIWWRNIAPLAAAGFEVIVPDLRGFGDSPIPADGFYDLATMSKDVRGLLHALGHQSAVFAGGDYGGMTIQDLGHRFPEVVRRQVLFNCVAPMLEELYAAHGVGGDQFAEINAISDHVLRHGNDADGLASELTSDSARAGYVGGYYTYRLWGHHGSFTPEQAAFMSAPFADADRFRASLVLYEAFMDPAKVAEPPILTEPHTARTLILYGQSDRVVGPLFSKRMELACRDRVGPFLIEDAGHFLQYERSELFNEAVRVFCLDLLMPGAGGTPDPR